MTPSTPGSMPALGSPRSSPFPPRSSFATATRKITQQLELGPLIAKGGFAHTYVGYQDGMLCVVKILVRDHATADFKRENEVLRKMPTCTHVVACTSDLLEVLDPATNVVRPAMVLEHGGACFYDVLMSHMAAVKDAATFPETTQTPTLLPLTPELKRRCLQQMTYAVQHLHDVADVCHRDIKPENMTIDHQGVVRLIDFGLARRLHDDKGIPNMFDDKVGTKMYVAPEVMGRGVYDGRMVDAWSLAVVAFAVTFHFLPVDVADPSDWRFGQLSHYQAASPGAGTVAHILGWYKRGEQLKTTCACTVKFIDALLVIDPSRRSPVRLSMLAGA